MQYLILFAGLLLSCSIHAKDSVRYEMMNEYGDPVILNPSMLDTLKELEVARRVKQRDNGEVYMPINENPLTYIDFPEGWRLHADGEILPINVNWIVLEKIFGESFYMIEPYRVVIGKNAELKPRDEVYDILRQAKGLQ